MEGYYLFFPWVFLQRNLFGIEQIIFSYTTMLRELSTITQLAPVSCYSYFLPCQRWLAVKEDDGQIARELVPVDRALKSKLSQKDSMAVRNEIALETAGNGEK